MIRQRNLRLAGLVLGLMILVGAGCGKSIDSAGQTAQDGSPVKGVGGFGTQCALAGTRGDPKPVQLTAFGCATDQLALTLDQPLLPIILQADCVKKEVLAYSVDGTRIENRWDALPDGRFFFTMDAGNAALSSDNMGHTSCQTPVTLEVAGLMKCRDRDHATIEVDATWHLNQTMPGTNAHLTEGACSVPTSCIFHAFTSLNQCGG